MAMQETNRTSYRSLAKYWELMAIHPRATIHATIPFLRQPEKVLVTCKQQWKMQPVPSQDPTKKKTCLSRVSHCTVCLLTPMHCDYAVEFGMMPHRLKQQCMKKNSERKNGQQQTFLNGNPKNRTEVIRQIRNIISWLTQISSLLGNNGRLLACMIFSQQIDKNLNILLWTAGQQAYETAGHYFSITDTNLDCRTDDTQVWDRSDHSIFSAPGTLPSVSSFLLTWQWSMVFSLFSFSLCSLWPKSIPLVHWFLVASHLGHVDFFFFFQSS